MAVAIAIAPETAGEAAEEEYDQDNDEYRSKRHGALPEGPRTSPKTLPRPGSKHIPGRESLVDPPKTSAPSFRGDAKHRTLVRNCAPENLEIPGLVLTHHPGMTVIASSAPRARSPGDRSEAASRGRNLPAADGARHGGGFFRPPPIPAASSAALHRGPDSSAPPRRRGRPAHLRP